MVFLVPPGGIEPSLQAPEARVLSIKLWRRVFILSDMPGLFNMRCN